MHRLLHIHHQSIITIELCLRHHRRPGHPLLTRLSVWIIRLPSLHSVFCSKLLQVSLHTSQDVESLGQNQLDGSQLIEAHEALPD